MDAVGGYEYDGHKHSRMREIVIIPMPASASELNSGEGSVPNSQNHGGLHGLVRINISSLKPKIFGVMNPHEKYIGKLNQFALISCVLSIFIDPLFFYLLTVDKEYKCVVINWPMAITLVVSRSITDFIYLLRMLIEFRLAYVSPESTVVGAGDLVMDAKKIALNYLSGLFFLDLLIVLPLPQMIVLFIQPNGHASPGGIHAKYFLQIVMLAQYVPRLYRLLSLLAGQSPRGFIFDAAWANFVINLLSFVLAGHVIGSSWYMLGLLRVDKCFKRVCHNSTIVGCKQFMDCGRGTDHVHFEGDYQQNWALWKIDENSSACFGDDVFDYGIYKTAVNLTTEKNLITRYVYSSFWGLQQISTLGGNQTPSYFVGEVLFMSAIVGLGLLLFALLIGNMQNFLQGLVNRRLKKSLRRRDGEEWMSHRRLPKQIREKVREAERYNWVATRGVDEESFLENLPEDLQTDIRRHLFNFIEKVKIFEPLKAPILDAICERLRQKIYIKGGTILNQGGVVTKMTFLVRGNVESIDKDKNRVPLMEGDVCGDELLTWCLEDIRNQRRKGNRLLSSRTVKCISNVEVFVLQAKDLQEVITLFERVFKNRKIQFAIRNKSPYWQVVAAITIQVIWRYRKKRLSRARDCTVRPSKSPYWQSWAATTIQKAWRNRQKS